MNVITANQVESLCISPLECVAFVEEAFRNKPSAIVPPKISIHQDRDLYFNTMPCLLPKLGRMAVKVVSRNPKSNPALRSVVVLFDASTGELLAVVDGDWITAMRTGAVAALAAKVFAEDFNTARYAFVGLGAMARAVFKCLHAISPSPLRIWLLKYKDQAERFVEEFEGKAEFHIVENKEELITDSNVLFSCVTKLDEPFVPVSVYPKGYLCIPVHTRGFQNCDLEFDRVFGDDAGHMRDWQNFSHFKEFAEFSDVLLGKAEGRRTHSERILSYNYGLGLHDLWFASKIYDMIQRGGK